MDYSKEQLMRTFLIGILISFHIFAASWSELEEGKQYQLNQSFQLPQLGERSGSMLDLSKGENFLLKEISALELGFPVTLYLFRYNNCPGPALKTDMELIAVSGTTPLVEVGVQLETCELSIYLETKDSFSQSLF